MTRETNMNATAYRAFTTWRRGLDAYAYLLRPRIMDPNTAHIGDFDYLFDPANVEIIYRKALDAASECGSGVSLDQAAPHKRVINFGYPDSYRIKCELWPWAEMSGPGSQRFTLGWADLEQVRGSSETFKTTLALIYLTHLHHKSKSLDADEVQWRLQQYLGELSGSDCTETERAHRTFRDLTEGFICTATANRIALQELRNIGLRPKRYKLPSRLARRALTTSKRRSLARTRIVPVVGPDGVGKTSVIGAYTTGNFRPEATSLRYKTLFRKLGLFRAIYQANQKLADRGVDTFGTTKSNLIDERISPLVVLSTLPTYCLLTFWVTIIRLLRKDHIVLMDRYFWDYLILPRSSTGQLARIRSARALLQATPRASLAVVLVAPPKSIRSRKEELDEPTIGSIYDHYLYCFARGRAIRLAIVPTTGTVEEAARGLQSFLSQG